MAIRFPINKHNYQINPSRISHKSERGLTLVESVVSLLIFFIALAGIVPLFLNYTISSINNEKRTAAIAVSQEVIDSIRHNQEEDFESIPTTGSETQASITYLDREYTPVVTYCQNSSYCSDIARHIKVEIFQNEQSIYEAETVFTTFDDPRNTPND
ncbi:type II secretion system protein [Acaryochloris sp. IP29b_bin.137]|uniref:type IV pilus modification PilV family protein n=1 Tax=Acaryochloris sp. IP29b_bin.137 TaxID=2969217 RepID=UPI0026322987|nr:type II secretion system protein [Acaryochloris sp. IP29b_bin.137]